MHNGYLSHWLIFNICNYIRFLSTYSCSEPVIFMNLELNLWMICDWHIINSHYLTCSNEAVIMSSIWLSLETQSYWILVSHLAHAHQTDHRKHALSHPWLTSFCWSFWCFLWKQSVHLLQKQEPGKEFNMQPEVGAPRGGRNVREKLDAVTYTAVNWSCLGRDPKL